MRSKLSGQSYINAESFIIPVYKRDHAAVAWARHQTGIFDVLCVYF